MVKKWVLPLNVILPLSVLTSALVGPILKCTMSYCSIKIKSPAIVILDRAGAKPIACNLGTH